jgi:DNA-binding CsgD family transcriptional regulator
MVLGRDAELGRMDALLAGLSGGRGFAVVVRGEPGVGKSALLDELAGRPGAGQVLRVCGTPSESEVAFSGLSELAQPLLTSLAELPPRQRQVMRSVLALEEGADHGRLAVFIAVTSFLSVGAESSRRLCLVDDAQWLDATSADALLFAARRLAGLPVGFVFAVRSGMGSRFDAAWLPTMALEPLSEAVAREVATLAAPDLGPSELSDVVAAAEGYPLALEEFARLADRAPGQRGLLPAGPYRVSERLERAFGAQAAALPRSARDALVVLAIADTSALSDIATALAVVPGSSHALDPAMDAGLVFVRDGQVSFRHPLVRSAVYQAAPTADLRAAHLALAAALAPAQPERAAWHRALAATAPDEQVAAALERTAVLARRRGGHAAEARALERAARLSPDPGVGIARLLAAGTAALLAGAHDHARALLREVTARSDDPLVLADAEHELAQLAFWREGRRSPGLPAAIRRVEPVAPARAARLYSFELAGLITDYQVTAALPIADRAWDLTGRRVEPFEVSFRVAHVLVMAGRTAAAADLADQAVAAVTAAGNITGMIMFAQPLWWLERYTEARQLLEAATAEMRASDGLWMLCHALIATAELERRMGRLTAAYSAAAEGLALAEQLGEPMQQAEALYEIAAAEAVLGEEPQVRAHVAQALRIVADRSFGVAEIRVATAAALGGAALAADRPEEAERQLEPAIGLVLAGGLMDPAPIPCVADLIEAHLACGHGQAAAALCDWLAERAEGCGRRWAQLAAVRCRTLLGTASADDLRRALAADDGAARLDSARAWLVLGAGLRRAGQRRDARAALSRASEIFEVAGASRWSARVADELRACGGRPAAPEAHRARLTPQETRVAMLVAQGARSRDVACALFLSERTVESHLTAIYRKLGLRSRAELAARLPAVAGLAGPAGPRTEVP